MNKQTAKDLLPLIQALADGKVVQWNEYGDVWTDTPEISERWPAERYRIKPEPREIWVNHYEEQKRLDQVCDSLEEALLRTYVGVDFTRKRYREVLE